MANRPAPGAPLTEGMVDGVALSLVPSVGGVRYGKELASHRTPSAALAALPYRIADTARGEARRHLKMMASLGGRVLLRGSADYPPALLDLRDPPPVLYALGRLELLCEPQLAMVGTRSATSYGLGVAREMARAAAGAGIVVTSGMARGVDSAAHIGALDAGGTTIAVLGTGVDVPYPSRNAPLYRQIVEGGLVISELPPGSRADAGSFPRRNRIIAALAPVTLVVQAGQRSGALITASRALELGRTVAAVPGPIDSASHLGSNELLRDGAHVVASAADLLQLAGADPRPSRAPELAGAEGAVWEALADGAADMDTLLARTGLPARECAIAVGSLELSGLVGTAFSGELRRLV